MLQQQNLYVKTQQPSTWADTSLHLRLLKGSMTSLINNRNLLSKSVYNSKSLNLKVVVSLSPNKWAMLSSSSEIKLKTVNQKNEAF